MKRHLEVAKAAAVKAGTILRECISVSREVSYKGEINLVTEMDRISERIVVATILEAFPDHGILAEEEAQIENGSGFLWIIDPLDGTTNYAHGYPSFSVSIGLEHSGDVIVGVVYDPMRNELFSAARGQGAHLNGNPIAVSRNDVLIRSLLATGFPYDRAVSRENNLDYFNALIMAAQEIRRSGSASLDLCAVAAGRLDGYWELKLHPWDVAAGSLIVQEAGGTVSDFAGTLFSIRDKELVASNGRIQGLMIDILNAVRRKA
ncbi:MAG: inositol monophosphatase family protein [Nitrospirota bacterium]